RSSSGKRRADTSDTSAGVIISATISSDSTTITGTARATMISGASTLRKPTAPMLSSHLKNGASSDQSSNVPRTASTAASQYIQPSPRVSAPATMSGASESSMTRGWRQY